MIFLEKKSFLREKENGGNEKMKRRPFLTALATVIKKDPTGSIRKHAKVLKVHEKTVRTAIKLDLIPDFNPVNYAI